MSFCGRKSRSPSPPNYDYLYDSEEENVDDSNQNSSEESDGEDVEDSCSETSSTESLDLNLTDVPSSNQSILPFLVRIRKPTSTQTSNPLPAQEDVSLPTLSGMLPSSQISTPSNKRKGSPTIEIEDPLLSRSIISSSSPSDFPCSSQSDTYISSPPGTPSAEAHPTIPSAFDIMKLGAKRRRLQQDERHVKLSNEENDRIIRKTYALYHFQPHELRYVKRAMERMQSEARGSKATTECWFHQPYEKNGNESTPSAQSTISRSFNTPHGPQGFNAGIWSLLVAGKLSEDQKKGLIFGTPTKGSPQQKPITWHLSHLCGNWLCINPGHAHVEPHHVNHSRKPCHSRMVACYHRPKCIIGQQLPREQLQMKTPDARQRTISMDNLQLSPMPVDEDSNCDSEDHESDDEDQQSSIEADEESENEDSNDGEGEDDYDSNDSDVEDIPLLLDSEAELSDYD